MNSQRSTRPEIKSAASTGTRSRAPVFVLGSPRSGTTLLYHMLLSSGGFAVYRSETHVFNILEAAYGDLGRRGNRKRLMKAWLGSNLFRSSGLDAREIERKVLSECSNGGEFLTTVMSAVAEKQGAERWADCTPDHLLYLQRIKETIPDALFVHVIRDGRDVALSMDKQGWIRPLPGDAGQGLMVSGLYWEWVVSRGRQACLALGGDYCEIRFEDLVQNPRSVLPKLSQFLEHDLNYDRIHKAGIGSVLEPNSSFKAGPAGEHFNPVARWKQAMAQPDLVRMEGLMGNTLKGLGYPVGTVEPPKSEISRLRRMRTRYRRYFDFKLWVKTRTPIGKWFVSKNLSWL